MAAPAHHSPSHMPSHDSQRTRHPTPSPTHNPHLRGLAMCITVGIGASASAGRTAVWGGDAVAGGHGGWPPASSRSGGELRASAPAGGKRTRLTTTEQRRPNRAPTQLAAPTAVRLVQAKPCNQWRRGTCRRCAATSALAQRLDHQAYATCRHLVGCPPIVQYLQHSTHQRPMGRRCRPR